MWESDDKKKSKTGEEISRLESEQIGSVNKLAESEWRAWLGIPQLLDDVSIRARSGKGDSPAHFTQTTPQ